jgi:hypothetical protein
MSTGFAGKVPFIIVPRGLNESSVQELKGEVDRVLGDIIDYGQDKFILDLSEFMAENRAATSLAFKVIEDCATLSIKLRIVANSEFARQSFGLGRIDKLNIFKDQASAAADF